MTVSLLLVGCDRDVVTFIDEGRAIQPDDAVELLSQIEPPAQMTDAGTASKRRTEALADLREQGTSGNRVADLITDSFPATTRSIPFYVERVSVEGTPAWLIVEAIGPRGSALTDERAWVLDDGGDVLYSATR